MEMFLDKMKWCLAICFEPNPVGVGIREEEMSQDLQCIANPSSCVMATWAHYSIFFCVSERFHDKTNKNKRQD